MEAPAALAQKQALAAAMDEDCEGAGSDAPATRLMAVLEHLQREMGNGAAPQQVGDPWPSLTFCEHTATVCSTNAGMHDTDP